MVDLIAQGIIKTNFIEFTPDLGELFTIYWSRVIPVIFVDGDVYDVEITDYH